MAELKILVLFLIINCEKHILCDNFENDHSWTESDPISTKTSPDDELTHVRSKTLNGNVKLTTLEVFTTNAPLVDLNNGSDGTVVETTMESVPTNQNKQARFGTITENRQKVVLLSEVGTKVPTDGSEPFALMDVFNSTSGTWPDQAPTEKLIVVTPLKPGLIDGNAEKNRPAEESLAEKAHFGNGGLETVSAVYPEETALSHSYVVKSGVFTTTETNLASFTTATTGNFIDNVYQTEESATATVDSDVDLSPRVDLNEKLARISDDSEDLSSFMNVDQDLLNTVEGNDTNRMEDSSEIPEDIYSILDPDEEDSNFSLSAEFNRNSDLSVATETNVMYTGGPNVKFSELDEFSNVTEDYDETIGNSQNLYFFSVKEDISAQTGTVPETTTFHELLKNSNSSVTTLSEVEKMVTILDVNNKSEILTETRNYATTTEEIERVNVILTTGSDIIVTTTNPPTDDETEKINRIFTEDLDMTIKEFDNEIKGIKETDFRIAEDLTKIATETEITKIVTNTENGTSTSRNIDSGEILNPTNCSTENLLFLQETTAPETNLASEDNKITEILTEETNIDESVTWTQHPITAGDFTNSATEAEAGLEISSELFKILTNTENGTSTNETETILATSENKFTEILTVVTDATEETNLNVTNNDNFVTRTPQAINVISTVTTEDLTKIETEAEVEKSTEKDTGTSINIGDNSTNFSTEDLRFFQEATPTETVLATEENRITEISTDVTNLDVINTGGVVTSTLQPIDLISTIAAEDLTKFATEVEQEITVSLSKILTNTENDTVTSIYPDGIEILDNTTNSSVKDLQFLEKISTTDSILETAGNRITEISTDVTNSTEETVSNFDITETQYTTVSNNDDSIAVTVSEIFETATQFFSIFKQFVNGKDLGQRVTKIVTEFELNDESTDSVTENLEIHVNVNLVISTETEMLVTEASPNIRDVNDILSTTEEVLTQTEEEFTTQTSFLTTKTASDRYQAITSETGEEDTSCEDEYPETVLSKEDEGKTENENEIEHNLINDINEDVIVDQEDIRENTTSEKDKETIVDDKILVINNESETRIKNDKDSLERGETVIVNKLFTSPLVTTIATINNDKKYAINNNIVYRSRHINQTASTDSENTNQMLTSTSALNHLKSAEEPQFKISLFSDKTEFNSSADEVLTTEEISTVDVQEPQMFINISGRIVRSSIKIIDNEFSFFVPSDASTAFHPPDIVHITWKSSNLSVNNSIELQFGTAIQVNIVKGNQMHMHKTENKLEDVDSNLIALGDGVQIYFSNPDFFKQDRFIGSEFMTVSDSSVRTLTGEIVGSCFGFLIIIAAVVSYLLIRKRRGKTRNSQPNNEA